MIPPESSQVSKSISESASVASKSQGSDSSSFSSSVIPLMDQITQYIRIPQLFYHLFSILLFFQFTEISLWTVNNPLWETTKMTSELVNTFHIVACFSPFVMSDNNTFILFIVCTVVFVLVVANLAAQLICYHQRRRFYKKTLYAARFLFELIPSIFTLPTIAFCGKMFLKIFEENVSIATICYFVITLVESIGFVIFFYVTNSLIGYSAYLPYSPWTAFDLSPFIAIVSVTPFFELLSFVAGHFPEWLIHPIVVLHIVFVIFSLIKFYNLPFVSLAQNIYFSFLLFSQIMLDILRLVFNFLKEINEIAMVVVFVLILVIGLVIPSICYSIKKKKMARSLQFDPDIDPTDDERDSLFQELKMNTNENTAILYYNYIIQNNIDNYLDFFPLKYILSHFRSNRAIATCIKIVSYFPSQSRTLNLLYADMSKRRDLNFKEKFLIHQIQKVKSMRQSSSSSAAMLRLKELTQNNKELETEISSFWSLNGADIRYLARINKKITKTKALWDEALIDFPNSTAYREEYSRFLIEVESNFSSAILQKHITELIESGKNFNVDMCFKQFIRNFPNYIKKHILDVKGNFIHTVKKRAGSAHSSNNESNGSNKNCNTSSSSMSELDVALEEGIGRTILSHSRIRLALQRATSNKKAKSFSMYLVFTLFVFLLGIVCGIVNCFIYSGYFDSRHQNAERLKNLADTRLYTFTSILSTFYSWGNRTDVINIDQYDAEYMKTDDESSQLFMDIYMNWEMRNSKFGVDARDIFDKFVTQIAELSDRGTDVYYYMEILFKDKTKIAYCQNGEVIEKRDHNLKTVLTYIFIATDVITNNANLPSWFDKTTGNFRWCTILSTAQTLYPSFDDLKDTIQTMATNDATTAQKSLKTNQYVFTFVYIFVSLLLFISSSIRYIIEINGLIKMLLQLPDTVKKDASKPLRKDAVEDDKDKNDTSSEIQSVLHESVIYIVIICIIFIGTGMVTFFLFDNIEHYNTQYQYLNLWTGDSLFRKAILIEITLWTTQLIVITNPLVSGNTFVTETVLNQLINEEFDILEELTHSLMEEGAGYPSAAGVDPIIDDALLKETCKPNSTETSYHEMYKCGSAQQLLNFFMNTISQVQVNLDTYGGFLNDEIPSSILHLSSSHLIPKMIIIDNCFDSMVQTFKKQYETKHIITSVIILVICIINVILSLLFLKYLHGCYNVALILVRKISPISIVADPTLVEYLLDTNQKKENSEMSTDQGIIHNSQSSVMCVDLNGIVDIINPAVSKTFGFSPEQLLGQSFSIIIEEESRPQVINRLELMRNMQSSLSFEDHTICVSDDESKMPCAITILGMTHDGIISSFVILLRDETDILAQQEEAEKAKKQSETLLFQILPRDIVIRLNQGEKDISFSVPSSTIMFVDIVKFSEYAASLTPQEIMGNLSLLFAGFDEMIAKHELLTKIKLIGDVYMCAGGLFTPDEPPVNHADQMIRFSMEVLQVLEDTNVKLSAVLNVRIGINTGGPLIAGVLGTDKPTFDIIGDPINVASRLQSTDIPGRVQISQATYEIVNELDYQIEQRGEVFLKGKGNQMAYLISPTRPLSNFSIIEGVSNIMTERKSSDDLISH